MLEHGHGLPRLNRRFELDLHLHSGLLTDTSAANAMILVLLRMELGWQATGTHCGMHLCVHMHAHVRACVMACHVDECSASCSS